MQLLYVCSPGNPTGQVMALAEWQALFELADRHGFVIASDECYSEIYFDEASRRSVRCRRRARSAATAVPRPDRLLQPVQALERARACAPASSPATPA